MGDMIGINELVEAIVMGNADKHLDTISKAIKERKAILTMTKTAVLKATLNDGDRVTFTKNIRPAYLAGVGATIVGEAKQKNILVKVDEASPYKSGKFFGKKINCPLSLLEVS